MRIVIPELKIDQDEAFKGDIFERKSFGQALTNLVENSDDALVISLDGKWGEGKTTFVKMWQVMLNENDIPNVYIDAFANDHMNDPFITVVSAIMAYVDEKIPKDKSKDFMEKSKKVAVQLLSWTAKNALKAATLGAINESGLEELKNIKGDITKGLDRVVENIIEDKLKSHADDVRNLDSFKELLSGLPKQLESIDKPLVIIIDELDRCRPTYALEMLEKIKHLFSVPKIVFVLVMNRGQLEESVKCIYGGNIDAHTYLQKFINVETKLPPLKESDYGSDISIYCARLFWLHEIKFNYGGEHRLQEFVSALAMFFGLSLRELERVTTSLVLVCFQNNKSIKNYEDILAFLAIVKVKYPEIFDDLLKGKIKYSQIEKIINPILVTSLESEYILSVFLSIRVATLSNDEFIKLPESDPARSKFKAYEQRPMRSAILRLSKQLNVFAVE